MRTTEPEELGPASNEAVLNSITDRSSSELPTLIEFSSQESTLPVPLYLLKPAIENPNFFGREDILKLLDKKLLPPSPGFPSSQASFALCGLGGVGKTQVAIHYAFSRRNNFDAIFWIDSDQPTQLTEGFSLIASHLGHTESPDQDRVVSRDIALEWLCNPRKRSASLSPDVEPNAKWLLIFNSVDNLGHMRAFWPHCSLGSILVTSRDPLAKTNREGVDLEPFKPKEASELLLKLLGLPSTSEHVDSSEKLATRLGGLPLAITQVAALIQRWDMTLDEFLEYFETQTSIAKVAKHKSSSDTHDHYKHSLFTVWALESLTAGALVLLQVMAYLSPDSIQEPLLQGVSKLDVPPQYPTTIDEFIDARTDLTKVSLIKRNKRVGITKGSSELTLHRLVQDVTRAHIDDSEQSCILIFVLRLLLASWPGEMLRFDHNSATWEISGALLPHILKLHDAFKLHKPFEGRIDVRVEYARLLLFARWYIILLRYMDNNANLYRGIFSREATLKRRSPCSTMSLRSAIPSQLN